jgi:putative addiction module component (TIGR02574 family)
MNIATIKSEISKLDLNEQLELLEQVWDSISCRQTELPIPEWKKSELDKRRLDLEQGNQGLHDSEEVHSTLRNRFQ